jgi:hypothetical protein
MFADNGYQALQAFATSIGIGLLIGLERERQSDIKAGLRTFALVPACSVACARCIDPDHRQRLDSRRRPAGDRWHDDASPRNTVDPLDDRRPRHHLRGGPAGVPTCSAPCRLVRPWLAAR